MCHVYVLVHVPVSVHVSVSVAVSASVSTITCFRKEIESLPIKGQIPAFDLMVLSITLHQAQHSLFHSLYLENAK